MDCQAFVVPLHGREDLIRHEPIVLELEPPVAISSNFCGDMAALNHMLNLVGEPPETQHLLLGNYVNRGDQTTCQCM